MSLHSTQTSETALKFAIKALILIFVSVCVGFMINFFSPLATLTMESGERVVFWISLCLIGGLGIFLCDFVLTGLRVMWSEWAAAFLKSICGTVAVLIPLYIFYDPAVIPRFSTTLLFIWLVMILILAGAAIMGAQFLRPKPSEKNEESNIADPSELNEHRAKVPPKILLRLPIYLQSAELYALSAEDHYVRVHTSKGDELVLMRFSDAVLETGDVEGLRVHRSWWVAKAAIANVKAKGRSAEITLKNTRKAPVSRNERKTIRDLGWI